MFYYENKNGEIVGRLYEAGSSWIAELGRLSENSVAPFVALRSLRFKTHRDAERYLKSFGLTSAAS